MEQQHLVIELAPAGQGNLKCIKVSFRAVSYITLAFGLVCLLGFGLFSNYLYVSWKASRYDALSAELQRLRTRYQQLQGQAKQHSEQMASLETLATEVSVAYGINPSPVGGNEQPMDEDSLTPNVRESIEEYNFLKAASYSEIYHHYAFAWQSHATPSLWPVMGVLRSSFGRRTDPFSGEGSFHTGIDIATPVGTRVRVTADGVVESARWSGRYGRLIAVDHGNGLITYYAHLSQFLVIPGQEVHAGQVIALSGRSGHVTGPHVHYEVRLAGTPVNPYKYLSKSPATTASAHLERSDLGL
jgi:murein DD-endopeptidase MepM/ murein hydrolase activator NlpD